MGVQHISRKRNVGAEVREVCLIYKRLHSEGMEDLFEMRPGAATKRIGGLCRSSSHP